MKKTLFNLLGLLALGLGGLGALLPVLPTVPFLMLAAACFARGSRRLHRWFTGTRLYRDNLEDLVAGRGMTRAAKGRVMGTVTALMAFGLVMMLRRGLLVPCLILGAVWLCHLLYFTLRIRTLRDRAV